MKIKTKQNNDEIDCIGMVYVENEIEQFEPIWLVVVYDENQTGQWCDRLYRCVLKMKSKLNWWDISNRVWYVTKTK